jgi:ribonuclease E
MAAAPAPAPVPAPAAADVSASLQQAGLVMIETAASAQPIIVEQTSQALGRKPKPVIVIPDEPLQRVETKHE